MKIIARVLVGATLLALTFSQTLGGEAAPTLQLPWPSGVSHRIYGGSTYGCGFHTGAGYFAIDFALARYDDVSAVAAGTVSFVGDSHDIRGNFVEIDHGGGLRSRYLHLDSWITGMKIGDAVSRGQVIGDAGTTGPVPAHLHFDLKLADVKFKAERMSNVPALAPDQHGFGWYGYSLESGLNPPSKGCIDPSMPEWVQNGCTTSTCGNIHDPSPYWTSVAPTWHGWDNWGAYADKSPVAISYSDDQLNHTHLAARTGSDIFVRSWTGTAWQQWQNISNGPSDPTFNGNVAISNHYGRIYVIATASNIVRMKYWDGAAWTPAWEDISLGKAITGPIAISYGTGGRIDVVGVASNKAWHKWYDGSWHAWWDMSGTTQITGSVAVANRDGLIHVVGWGGGVAKLKWWNGSGWYGWQSLVSPVDGSLAIDNTGAVVGNTSSTHYGVHIVAMAGGNAWLRCWENSDDCNVSGWLILGGPLAGPLAVTNQNAQTRVVGKDSGSTLWHKWRG